MTSSKNYFTDKKKITSKRYLLLANDQEEQDFDDIKEVDHTAEIEQDIMPPIHTSNVHETERSEFRKLPQIDSFESDILTKAFKGNRKDYIRYKTQMMGSRPLDLINLN